MKRLEGALAGLASPPSDLAGRDPRAPIVVTAFFLVIVVSFDRYAVAALLPLALYPAIVVAQAQLAWSRLALQLLLAAPFALVVGLANPWLERAPIEIYPGWTLAAGWISWASIAVRSVLTLSAALVLVGAWGIYALCAALARLGVPDVFTSQMLFLHRYVFVLGGEAQQLLTARRLRGATRLSIREFSALLGLTLLRAFERAQRIHAAMRARGFHGRMPPAETTVFAWRWVDTVYVLGWCTYFAFVRMVNVPVWLGHAITWGLH